MLIITLMVSLAAAQDSLCMLTVGNPYDPAKHGLEHATECVLPGVVPVSGLAAACGHPGGLVEAVMWSHQDYVPDDVSTTLQSVVEYNHRTGWVFVKDEMVVTDISVIGYWVKGEMYRKMYFDKASYSTLFLVGDEACTFQ